MTMNMRFVRFASLMYITLHTVSIVSMHDVAKTDMPSVSSDECLHRNKLLEASILDYSYICKKMHEQQQELLAGNVSQSKICNRSCRLTQQEQQQQLNSLPGMESDNHREVLFINVFFVH